MKITGSHTNRQTCPQPVFHCISLIKTRNCICLLFGAGQVLHSRFITAFLLSPVPAVAQTMLMMKMVKLKMVIEALQYVTKTHVTMLLVFTLSLSPRSSESPQLY